MQVASIATRISLHVLNYYHFIEPNSYVFFCPFSYKFAAKILPLVKNEHLLLCTLLIGKSLAMEVCRLLRYL